MDKTLIYKLIIVGLLFLSSLNAQDNVDDLSIDDLLSDIENKTDLSQKTKLENSGISFIFTRDDIERMQARYLKDILKSDANFAYKENRYNLADPLSNGDSVVFMSSMIRVYIDNQEITSGMYGSGMITYGDIDIGFVDHIELYAQSPTYEYVTEPTMMLIKLYSKSTAKDEGTKVEVNVASYKSSRVTGQAAHDLGNSWSYFSYATLYQNNRPKTDSFGTELSRDSKNAHLFASFQNKNHHILVDALKVKKDMFAEVSMDATPSEAYVDFTGLHLGYDGTVDNFSFLATYDYLKSGTDFKDDVTPILGMMPIANRIVNTQTNTFTGEVKYKLKTTNNTLTTGLKYRYKKFNVDKFVINSILIPDKSNTAQSVSTVFMEDQYLIEDNFVIIGGVQYVHVKNNGAKFNKKNDLMGYRLGATYLTPNWTFKTIASHTEFYLEPYLVDSTFIPTKDLDTTEADIIYEDIIYKVDNNKYELIAGYMKIKNYLTPNGRGQLDTYQKDLDIVAILARWTYSYSKYDKLFSEFSYQQRDNLPFIQKYKIYKVVIRGLNTFGKFDIFNEVIYDRNNFMKKNFYDWSAGVKYNHTKDLIISVKGENILNKAQESEFMRMDPSTSPFQPEEPLSVSPIDRKFTLSLEYLF